MKNLKHRIIEVLFVAGLLVTGSASAGVLTDFAGNSKAISDYTGNGKWRIVMIWASDCHVCNSEAHSYVKFNREHEGKDAQMLGISIDGKAKLKDAEEFVKRHKLNFPNLVGEPVDVAVEYMQLTQKNWVGTPSFLVYNPEGKLVAAEAGAVPVEIIEKFIQSNSQKNGNKS